MPTIATTIISSISVKPRTTLFSCLFIIEFTPRRKTGDMPMHRSPHNFRASPDWDDRCGIVRKSRAR